MTDIFISYIAVLAFLLLLDGVWLLGVAPQFYKKRIGHLMAEKVSFIPVALFYAVYSLGIVVLVFGSSLHNGSLLKVFALGALLGLSAYGAYDFTNHATLKNWPTSMSVVDIVWGSLMTGTASVGALWIVSIFT